MSEADQPKFAERNLPDSSYDPVDGSETPQLIRKLLLRLPAFRGPVKGRRVRDAIVAHLAAVVLAGLAAAARLGLDPFLPPGIPYLTFFPAVVITGFIWGPVPGLTCAILSGVAAWYWFMPPFGGFDLNPPAITALAFYVVVIAIDLGLLQLAILTARSLARTQQALNTSISVQKVVSAEVDHRLKNLIATVNGLIALSQKYAETPEELACRLRERINAMGQSVALLRGAAHGQNPGLRDVILSTLQSLGADDGGRLTLRGRDNALVTSALIPLNLMVHELGTNSVKYGALSSEAGTVTIEWEVLPSAPETVLRLVWTERNGPIVVEPTRSGFGTVLVNRMSQSLGGSSEFSYRETGLIVTITMEGSRVLANSETRDSGG